MQAQPDDRTLRRIIATLVALALLAERAAGRSFPVRFLVFAILSRAEPVARAFVADIAQIDLPELDDGLGTSAANATLLALHFRMLAALLDAVLERPDARHGMDPARAASLGFSAPSASRPRATSCAVRLCAPDTS